MATNSIQSQRQHLTDLAQLASHYFQELHGRDLPEELIFLLVRDWHQQQLAPTAGFATESTLRALLEDVRRLLPKVAA